MDSPRLVSLFSGCGGLDLGFEQAGFKRVWANDFDKDAQAVFRLNLGEIDGRDIRDIGNSRVRHCARGFSVSAFFQCRKSEGRT